MLGLYLMVPAALVAYIYHHIKPHYLSHHSIHHTNIASTTIPLHVPFVYLTGHLFPRATLWLEGGKGEKRGEIVGDTRGAPVPESREEEKRRKSRGINLPCQFKPQWNMFLRWAWNLLFFAHLAWTFRINIPQFSPFPDMILRSSERSRDHE